MCGIAGIFEHGYVSRSKNQILVKSAIEIIKHRGPDEQGFYNQDNCSLGVCRLAIIDVNGGHQPSQDSFARIFSVFNGEIYNFKELRKLLSSRGYILTNEGDSEIIPNLYREFGLEFPKFLNGMFAIALWDEERNLGLLARDRFGQKPLWYKHEGDRVVFSSELKGLIALEGNLEFDPRRLPEYLQFGYINAPKSIYQGVKQLVPGASLIFEEGRKFESRYWNYPSKIQENFSYGDAKVVAKTLITDAIDTHLISERPIGVFLSGGIDSSLVAALTSQKLGSSTNSYTIGFENRKFDESKFAQVIASHLALNHHEKIVLPDPVLIVSEISRVLDQPFADSSIIPTFLLAKFASQEVVVALGGDGGDEVFGGYERYRATKLLSRLNFLLLLNPSLALRKINFRSHKIEKLLKNLKFQKFSSRYIGFQSLIPSSEVSSYIREEIDETIFHLELMGFWDETESESALQKMQIFDLKTYLPGDLMYKSDIATMANSLELRSPLLDNRVVDFGLSLPDKFKIKNGVSKRILKDLLYEFVPRELVDRPKMGFGIPQAEWLRLELAELVNQTLLSKSTFVGNYLDVNQISQVISQHNGGKNMDKVIWPIFMLELWAKNWIT